VKDQLTTLVDGKPGTFRKTAPAGIEAPG